MTKMYFCKLCGFGSPSLVGLSRHKRLIHHKQQKPKLKSRFGYLKVVW
jgi:hypothetical protein